MSIYIHSIEINNFRQFIEQKIEFKPGFNLIVGENGAGKTTILRGIIAALGASHRLPKGVRIEDIDIGFNQRILNIETEVHSNYDLPSYFGFTRQWGKGKSTKAAGRKRPVTLFYSSNESVSREMRGKAKSRTPDLREFSANSAEEYLFRKGLESITNRSGMHATNENKFGDSNSVRLFVEKILAQFSEEISEFYWRFVPYDCELVFPEELEPSRNFEVGLVSLIESFVLRWFEEESAFRRRSPFVWPDTDKVVLPLGFSSKNSLMPQLTEIWEEVRKEFGLSSEVNNILENCSLEVSLTPRIVFHRGDMLLTLDQLSEGEKRLFMLFVDIARQLSIRHNEGSLNSFGSGEAIILIDEIDVHLHPKWQRLIVPALEELFPNCQFIATTHSPFVIQAVDRDKIIAIDQRAKEISLEGGNSIEDIVEDIQGVAFPQRSIRAEKLNNAAEEYFKLLEVNAENSTEANRAALLKAEISYRDASEPFTTDPAVHALLKILAEGSGKK